MTGNNAFDTIELDLSFMEDVTFIFDKAGQIEKLVMNNGSYKRTISFPSRNRTTKDMVKAIKDSINTPLM